MLRRLADCYVRGGKQNARRGSPRGAGPGGIGGGRFDGREVYFTAGMKPTFSTTAWPAGPRVNSMNLAASPEASPLV